MPKTRGLPITDEKIIDRLVSGTGHSEAAGMDVFSMVRIIRKSLWMTQAQLARRVGLPQSHIARIETGKLDAQLSTLKRIFTALGTELSLRPIFRRSPKKAVEERAKALAERRVTRLMGTMALEKQAPDRRTRKALLRSELDRIMKSRSTAIWEED